jgi:hypothetical protein
VSVLESPASGYGQIVASSGQCNKHSGTIICAKFCDELDQCKLLKQNSAPWIYLVTYYVVAKIRDSVDGILTRYGLDSPGIEFRWWRGLLYPSRPALGPTQSPVRWALGFPRLYNCRGVALTTNSHLVPLLRKERSCTCTPVCLHVLF